MKISLISVPPDSENVYYIKTFRGCEYSSLKILSASVERAMHDAQLIDAATLLLSNSEILKRLEDFKPDVIGISPTLSSMKNSLLLARQIKQWETPPKVIMGGHHASLCAEAILSNEPDVDFIFLGEAETSLVTFLDKLEKQKDIKSIDGIAIRQGGKILINEPAPVISDLDQLPQTQNSVLLELQNCHPVIGTTIQSSRGCPYNCSFCTSPVFFKDCRLYRKHSYQHVVNEMERICQEFDIHLFNFTDDLFLPAEDIYKRWGIDFADELIRKQLPVAFSVMLRSDIFQPKFTGMIQKLQKAGLHQVLVGMENISPLSLKKYNKGTSIHQYHSAINSLEELNIFLIPAFINFNPYLTRTDFIKNITFLNELVHTPVLFQFTSHLTVFPGTPIVDALRKDGFLVEKNLSYSRGLSYRFSDPVIQVLSNGFQAVIEKPFPSDSLVEEVQHLMAHNRATGSLSCSEYNDLFKQSRNIHIKMAEIHCSIMNKCLRFADQLDSNGVENVLSEHYSNGCNSLIAQLIALRDNLLNRAIHFKNKNLVSEQK